MEKFKLNNGVEIPCFGIGTFMIEPDDAERSVEFALRNGYRLIDTYIKELLEICEVKPQVIQVECHPYFPQEDLRKDIEKEDIKIMSWYPLGHEDSNLINEEVFAKLAQKYNKTNAQIILRWHIQMGFIVIPGTKHEEHILQNGNILDFALTDEEMNEIAKINKNKRYYERTTASLMALSLYKPNFENQK